jgi:predicted phosphodiesterase
MRTAILSDIHANLVSLTSLLDAVDKLDVERILCLGDIVGYNPWPNECIRIVRERSIPCVMGNHDRVAAGLEEPDYFNAMAREAILWTRRNLTDEHRDYLLKLPARLSLDDTTILVHGSPRDPDEYILMTRIAHENITYMQENLDASVCFFGHTHLPGIFDLSDVEKPSGDTKVFLKKEDAYLINPGSVGQPRDGDPRSSFLIYDADEATVQFYHIAYDIDAVYEAIVKAGLPAHLGRRLFLGS